MLRRSSRTRAILVAMAVLLAGGGVVTPAAPDLFDEIFARGRPLQERLQTVRARFTETTVSSLLAKPTVARGTLLAAKPPRLRLDYTSPERKTVVMAGNRLAIAWPDRAEGDTVDITETMKRVNRYFAEADPGQLRRVFTIRAFEDREIAGTYQIEFVPKRRQVREGLERLQLWLERDTLLLVQMRMSFPGGNSDTIRLEGTEINVPVDPASFDVAAPPARRPR